MCITNPEVPLARLRALARRQRNPLRRDIVEAMEMGLRAADPRTLLRRHVRLKEEKLVVGSRKFDLSKFNRVLVLGGGKASAGMALEIERILGDRIVGGVVNVPDRLPPMPRCERILLYKATHPLPTAKGVKGVEKMLVMVGRPDRRDLVICLLSGGGSALMPMPITGIMLADKRKVTELLLKFGARIDEINTVRRHLSAIKGGRLAERLYPAIVISLMISDVAGDRLEDIASGPTAPDPTTYSDVRRILRKYRLEQRVPASVRRLVERGIAGRVQETPKPGSKVFKNVHNIVVGNNRNSCVAAAQSLREKGYKSVILSTNLQGEARSVGKAFAKIILGPGSVRLSPLRPRAVVAAGEATVAVKGKGLGGRNQELVLSAALTIQGRENVAVGAMSTDGVDGPTRAAGALADVDTVKRGLTKGLRAEDFLENNDSYHFFNRVDGLIVTGPTGTNVNDLVIGVAGSSQS